MKDLLGNTIIDFNNNYYTSHLITYLGNKRTLLPFINRGIEIVKKKLNKEKLVSFDGFSGSGVVSRLLKSHSSSLYVNDLESYAYIINKCYLANKSTVDVNEVQQRIDFLNNLTNKDLIEGFIYSNYAPKDDTNIKAGERVFYTSQNAKILDTLKKYIYSHIPSDEQYLFLSPLIVQASIHTNTSGVFKGFHKKHGIGCFGGAGENALCRIKKRITLAPPIFSKDECDVFVFQKNVNQFFQNTSLPVYDVAYYDPPYNQHPYGSNYFMLNILATEKDSIPIQNGVSGIAEDWNRSAYNKKTPAVQAMNDLIKNTPAKYILISYNNEGIIPIKELKGILEKYGEVSLLEQDYNTYRGCRNLKDRNIKVKELLWILKKKE